MSVLTTLRNVPFETQLQAAIPQLRPGAFLVCGNPDKLNPMTIGWCMFGQIWSLPTIMVLVRQSRYSHKLMEEYREFGVSFPAVGECLDALSYCGRVSGRDHDKFADLGAKPVPLQGGAFGFDGCERHFACRRLFKAESDLNNLETRLIKQFYSDFDGKSKGDPHTLYIGEILSAWTRE